MLFDDIIARIESRVTDLAGRVEGAAEMAALVRENALPDFTPAAFVLPLGQRPGSADVVTPLYRQPVVETIGIVLMVSAPGDVSGESALPTIRQLSDAIILALAGWQPPGGEDVMVFARGTLLSMQQGTVVYQTDFTLQSHLRITP